MTTPYFLAGESGAGGTAVVTRPQIPKLVLESLDGSVSIPLDGTQGFIRMPGSTGLGMHAVEIINQAIPGVAGTRLADVVVPGRAIFIPIYAGANNDMVAFRAMMRRLYALVDPMGKSRFRLIGQSVEGSRELTVTYVSGLEGNDEAMQQGLSWAKFGLNLWAQDPFPRSREETSIEFRSAETADPWLGVAGGTDATWPAAITTTSVIGEDMEVLINSELPVYPTVTLTGPMDSFTGDLSPVVVSEDGIETTIDDQEWSISIPAGVPANSTFVAVTDPRARSFRLNGALAAGRVALGSRLRPFYPGRNTLNVAAVGNTPETVIRIAWYELHRSLE